MVVSAVVVTVVMMVEVEEVKEIADGRAVQRHIGIIVVRDWVREIVAAAVSERFEVPVALDEFEDGNVISVAMADVAAGGEGRHDDERNAWAIAKEIERLDVAGIVVTAAFVHGDDKRGFREEGGVALQVVEGFFDHAFEEINL